jgi:hypothetical protein
MRRYFGGYTLPPKNVGKSGGFVPTFSPAIVVLGEALSALTRDWVRAEVPLTDQAPGAIKTSKTTSATERAVFILDRCRQLQPAPWVAAAMTKGRDQLRLLGVGWDDIRHVGTSSGTDSEGAATPRPVLPLKTFQALDGFWACATAAWRTNSLISARRLYFLPLM